MKTILCFGDSNTWGAMPMRHLDDTRRYGPGERWPGVLAETLGDGYRVIEEGLNGRTTVWDDPIDDGEIRNGRRYFLACLLTHRPLDLVVIMLGTNDLKPRFSATAFDISRGASALAATALASDCGPDFGRPPVLLVCPPPILETGCLATTFEGAAPKSARLPEHYRATAQRLGIGFLDAGPIIQSSPLDGIHLEAEEHRKLGQAVARAARDLVG